MPQTIPVQFTGSKSFLGVATETAYNDGAAATDYIEILTGDSLETDPGNIAVETIRNTRALVSHFISGPTWSEGGWSQPLWPNQGIRFFAAALGYDLVTTFIVQIPGTATGGTFTVTVGANTTSAQAYNVSAGTLQSAIQGLASVGSGNATVTLSGTTYTVALNASTFTLASQIAAISLASSVTGGGTAVVYVTHALTCREDGLPSLSIEKGGSSVNPNGSPTVLDSLQYGGALISKLKMSGAIGSPIKCEYSIVGQPETQIVPSSPSWVADTPYSTGDVNTFTVFTVTQSQMVVTAWEFELDNDVQREQGYTGSNAPALIYAGSRKISGKLSILIMDWSWVNDALNGTLGNVVIGMAQTALSLPTATITLSNVKFMKPSKPVQAGKQRVIELPFTGSLAVGAPTDIKAVATNSYNRPYV